MKLLAFVLVCAMALSAMEVQAKRLGGGNSLGKQSNNVTQRNAAPPAPAAPAQNAATPAKPVPAAAQPPVAAKKPWGAMLGGLAAGLGLAWLAHSLGLGEAFGQFLLVALLVLVVVMVVGFILRARVPDRRPGSAYAYQGASPAGGAPLARQYSVDHVGNDASARPWERSSMAFDAGKYPTHEGGATGVQIGSALSGSQSWGVPSGFDVEGFLGAAKRNFITLQDAWDQSDIPTLRSMMTDEMLGEIRSQLAERESHASGAHPNKTDVVMLEAKLLGIEDLGDGYMASVEFSGMIKEDPSQSPGPFREVWNMTKAKDGRSGWLVAGLQALN